MNIDSKLVSQIISSLSGRTNCADDDRKRLITLTIAKGIAYALPIPGQKVVSFRRWYIEQAEPLAKEFVSDINEVVVVDVRQTLELTFQILRARYAIAFDPRSTELHKVIDSLVANDATRSIEPNFAGIFERIVANAYDLNDTANAITGIALQALGGENE